MRSVSSATALRLAKARRSFAPGSKRSAFAKLGLLLSSRLDLLPDVGSLKPSDNATARKEGAKGGTRGFPVTVERRGDEKLLLSPDKAAAVLCSDSAAA